MQNGIFIWEERYSFCWIELVKEAKAKAVFCIRSTFWEILTKAKIEGYNADLKKCADEIFNEKKTLNMIWVMLI